MKHGAAVPILARTCLRAPALSLAVALALALSLVGLALSLSGLCLVDLIAKKACSTQAETNQGHLYAHCTATHTLLHHVHISALY